MTARFGRRGFNSINSDGINNRQVKTCTQLAFELFLKQDGPMISSRLEHFFKPEVRRHGEELVAKIHLSSGSDTSVQAFVRASTPAKVQFSSTSISSPIFNVHCSCPAGTKKNFCKHIWATLLAAQERYPDFFDSKTDIENVEKPATSYSTSRMTISAAPEAANRMQSAPQDTKQAAYKQAQREKQSAYQKAQYEKQKARAKEFRAVQSAKLKALKSKAKDKNESVPNYPDEVAEALRFFNDNGFSFSQPFDIEELRSAKKKLARVFHPDRGGTIEESLILNENFDVLASFMSR